MLSIMGGITEFERGLIRTSCGQGIERAKRLGKQFGRPNRLDASQKRVIADRYVSPRAASGATAGQSSTAENGCGDLEGRVAPILA
jgi:DNA invertase Pin-like site-specific DNA recombinase